MPEPDTKPLCIGFVLDDTLDKSDGVQQYVLTVSAWLMARGHEVHFLVGQTKRTDLPHIHSLAKNIAVTFNQNKMSIPLPAPRGPIRKLLATTKFDVLHVQMPYNPLLAARIIRLADPTTAVVGTFHILPFSWLESVATKLLRLWLRRTLQRFDSIVSVSEPARQFALRAFRVDSTVIPNAVDVRALQPATPPAKPTVPSIVFVGRLVSRKGCLYLLKALVLLRQQAPAMAFELTICGKGGLEPELRAFVANYGLTQQVTFAGFVSEAQKANYLSGATIAVFPSTGGESFGIVLIEAMSAGARVVVGGNNPGYSSVLNDSRVLVDPTDTPAFCRLLQSILGDQTLQEAIHADQQALVQRFDIATVGAQLETTYRAAVAKRLVTKHNDAHA